MGNTTKILFSAVTRIGTASIVNDDRIYANGKFIHPSAADYSQISLEASDSNCLFALSDGMEDEDTGISVINELRKFHDKTKTSSKNIHVKLDDLVQCVEQTGNLLHSISLGESDFRQRRTAFAGVLIDNGSIAAVNLGSCRIYQLDGNSFRLVINDYKRAERLLKMGIINDEQAEMLSGQKKSAMEIGTSTVKKSDADPIKAGQVYLLCSNGLAESVSEDKIYDILASDSEPDEMASSLVAEAFKNDSGDDLTAIVIKIEENDDSEEMKSGMPKAYKPSRTSYSKRNSPRRNDKKGVDVGGIASMLIFFLLLAAVVFGGYKLWMKVRAPEVLDAINQNESTSSSTNMPGNTADIDNPDDETDPDNVSGLEDPDGETGSDETDPTHEGSNAGANDNENLVGPEGTTYVVKPGDMLMKISKKFYGDESKYKLIMEANNMTDPNMLQIGQTLKIPPLN
jgi:serine/threonine protein phosphatase PrpC